MVNSRTSFLKKIRTINLFLWLSVAAAIGMTGCGNGGSDQLWLVSLGDSLAVGVQPDASGMNQTTDKGYADVLYQLLLPAFPNLKLLKLGCPGETTVSMVDGGICSYPAGSQLDAARQFILAHQDEVLLVTIDIGVNDLLTSGCIDTGPPLDVDLDCITNFLKNILPANLTFVMNELFQIVDGTSIPVLGMNYYNPFVVIYFQIYAAIATGIKNDPATIGPIVGECQTECLSMMPLPPDIPACINDCATRAVGEIAGPEAVDQVKMLGIDNLAMALDFQVLQGVYDLVHFPVADIYTAFMAGDFTLVPIPSSEDLFKLGVAVAPVNALAACQLTFMCPAPMSGLEPNIHATDEGYQLIGKTFFDLFNSL